MTKAELFRRGEDGIDEYLIDFEGTLHAELPISLEPDEALTLVLNYTPRPGGERPVGAALILDTNGAEGQVVVPIVVDDAGAPAIRVAPTVLRFGVVEPGAESTLEFTVTNLGREPLRLHEVGVNGSDEFTLAAAGGAPLTPERIADPDQDGEPGLGSLQSTVIGVRYAPQTHDRDHAEVLIQSNDRDHPEVEVEVEVALYGNAPDEPQMQVQVEPAHLSFGAAAVGGTVRRPLSIINRGATPVEIQAIELDDSSDPEMVPAFLFEGLSRMRKRQVVNCSSRKSEAARRANRPFGKFDSASLGTGGHPVRPDWAEVTAA